MVGPAVTPQGLRIPLAHDRAPRLHAEPAPSLPSTDRYRRSWLVQGVGEEGQRRLGEARVLVVGAGGLGSPVLAYLAAAGVGTLGICDGDAVEEHNLQRQVIHDTASVGLPKAESARERLSALNPYIHLETHGFVTTDFLEAHGREWDLVVECTDTFSAKYLVADWCHLSGVPLVWGTVVSMSFQVSVMWSHAPAPWPRTWLRQLHPTVPPAGTTPSSLDVGVLGPVVGQAGSAMATEAIKLITGCGCPLLGSVLIGDVARNRYTTLEFASGDVPRAQEG